MQLNKLWPEKTISDIWESNNVKNICQRNRRSSNENFENSLDKVDLPEQSFLLSRHIGHAYYWCSKWSRGGLWHEVCPTDWLAKVMHSKLIDLPSDACPTDWLAQVSLAQLIDLPKWYLPNWFAQVILAQLTCPSDSCPTDWLAQVILA